MSCTATDCSGNRVLVLAVLQVLCREPHCMRCCPVGASLTAGRCTMTAYGRSSHCSTRSSRPCANACRTCTRYCRGFRGTAGVWQVLTSNSRTNAGSRCLPGQLQAYTKLTSELETLPSALLASPSRSMTRTCMPLRDPSSFSVSAVPAAWSRIAEMRRKWQLHDHHLTRNVSISIAPPIVR